MNHYEILGVPIDASQDQIARTYRHLAREYHPDANGGDPEKSEKFKLIAAAYEVLRDNVKRAEYDRKLPKRLNKKKKPTKAGPLDYSQDPNLGRYSTPQAPRYDIWGRKLSEAERQAWYESAASELPTRKRLPRRNAPKPKDEFIDVFSKQYMKDDLPDLR